jgi:hypothetical protein
MDFLKPIKSYLGQYLLNRELQQFSRTQQFYNLKMAETIGIVYEYKDEEEFKLVEQLIHQLNNDKKRVKVLVYIKDAKMLEYIPQRLTVDYIQPSDIDKLGRPNSSYVRDFIRSRFHILMDLNYGQSFPLIYVASLSQAYYKVGLFNDENKNRLDLLIKMEDGKGLTYIIREMIIYLKILKPFDSQK